MTRIAKIVKGSIQEISLANQLLRITDLEHSKEQRNSNSGSMEELLEETCGLLYSEEEKSIYKKGSLWSTYPFQPAMDEWGERVEFH